MSLFSKIFGHPEHPHKVKYASIDYNQYFDQATINNTPVAYKHLGDLNVTTGKIIACDPLISLCDASPFTRTIAPGKYPVTACVVKTESYGERHAFVKLEFNKETATKWEMALLKDQDVDSLTDEDEIFGFPVDAGLACFCDEATQKLYNKFDEDFMIKNPKGNIYDDHIEAEFRKNSCHPNDPESVGDWINFCIPHQPDENVIMFSSGLGDGIYPSYWGISEEGNVCSLVVDLQVFYRLG